MPTKAKRKQKISACGKKVEEAVKQGVRDALELHAKLGQPVVEWRDGKVVWVSPREIRRRLKKTGT